MKICVVSPEPIYPLSGGGTIGTLKIVERMVKEGMETHVITPLHKVNKNKVEKMFRIKMHPFNPFVIRKNENLQLRRFKNLILAFLLYFKIDEVVNTYGIDLVLARNFVAGIGARLNKLKNNTPYMVSVTDITSGYFYNQYKLPKKIVDLLVKLEIRSMKDAEKIFVITKEMKRVFVRHGIRRDKIKVVYDGVEIEKFNKNLRTGLKRKLGLENYEIIFFHGTMEPHMGLFNLIKNVKRLGNEVKMVLVGDGPIMKKLVDYVKDNDIENVIFLGRVDYKKIPEYISMADICIIPYPPNFSTNLILTLKLLEYAAMGKPILCTRLKGVREFFKDKESILYYDDKNSKDFVKKVYYLLENKRFAKRIGKNARRVVEKDLNWSVVTDRVLREV